MKVKLLGISTKKEIEKQVNICAAACKLSRMPGKVFEAIDSTKDYEKAVSLIKRVIKMGHTSTIDHDYLVFALSEVSPLVEQTIIAERFSSFTVKSRREVDFSNVGFFTPDFHDKDGNIVKENNKLKREYKKYMKSLFNSYSYLVDNGITKEDARFVLPYSYNSEIIMGLDATALVRMITKLTRGKHSNITELKELGEELKKIALTRTPYIEALLETQEILPYSETENILDTIIEDKKYELLKEPVLLSYTKDIDKTLFINAIARIYSFDYNKAEVIYNEKIKDNEVLQEKLMKAIFNEYDRDDLRQINFRFQLAIPFSILTHYTRHRRLNLSIKEFVPVVDLNNYITPPCIKNNEHLNKYYENLFLKNTEVYNTFKNYNIREEDLVYFTLSGHAINVIINYDGEAFRTFARVRSCTKAQWFIRENTIKMINQIKSVSKYYGINVGPDCVTKHFCGEGKESCGRINTILKNIK